MRKNSYLESIKSKGKKREKGIVGIGTNSLEGMWRGRRRDFGSNDWSGSVILLWEENPWLSV